MALIQTCFDSKGCIRDNKGRFIKHQHYSSETEFTHDSTVGSNNPMYGVPSPMTGRHLTVEQRLKQSKKLKGKSATSGSFKKGHTVPQEWRRIASKKLKGKVSWNNGKTHQEDSRIPFGKNHASWKGGLTQIHVLIRKDGLYENWIKPIMKRDNYTCQVCNSNRNICVHHNDESMKDIVYNFVNEYSFQFKNKKEIPYELKIKIAKAVVNYHTKNKVFGITLCKECHKKTDDYLKHTAMIENGKKL